MDPTFLPATRLAEMTRRREIGCLELLDHYIGRVERYDGAINAECAAISAVPATAPANWTRRATARHPCSACR